MPSQMARGAAVFRHEYELVAAALAVGGLVLGIAISPWFFVASGAVAALLPIHAFYGRREVESVLELPQRRVASRPARVNHRNHRFDFPRNAPAGPWRVVTDPLSEARRLPASGDIWTIIDSREQVVFTGTKRDCEDWLDWQDNRGM